MANIYHSVTELVGGTPLVELHKIEEKYNTKAKILAKLEYFNPTGSAKDRAALFMVKNAEKAGIINKNSVIIEPTSGNTGIGLAAIAGAMGYKVIIVMPDSMSVERQKMMKAYGAELVLTDGKLGMKGAIEKAEELNRSIEGSFIAGQFENPANAEAHFVTTGPEIYRDTDGEVDAFVSAVGTGGTITGVGRFLKGKNENIKIFAVEPDKSNILSGGKAGPHKIQGIGAGFIPEVLDTDIYDEVITASAEESYAFERELAADSGIFVGISGGAALSCAVKVACRDEFEGKTVVVLLTDSGTRYLSSEMLD